MLAPLWQVASLATAQAEGAPQPTGCGSPDQLLLPIILFAVLYFVWLRPAQKERKKHQELIEALKRGDEVLTQSGIFGTITDMDDKVVTLELSRNAKAKFLRTTVVRKVTEPSGEAEASKASKASK